MINREIISTIANSDILAIYESDVHSNKSDRGGYITIIFKNQFLNIIVLSGINAKQVYHKYLDEAKAKGVK
jgi:hypothetical protein